MKAFATGCLLALALVAAGCGGEFTPLGNEPGRGGNGAAAGMAGTSGNGGTAAAGAPGTGGSGGSGASGGSGPASQCTTDSECPRSLVACQVCADGSTACPWAHCVSGQCTAGIDTCPAPADPCAGKSCGDACSTCTGTDPCPAIAMFCDQNLTCQVNEPVCGTTMCTTSSDCKTTVDTTGKACPDGSTVTGLYECVSGQCAWVFPSCPAQCTTDTDCPRSLAPCQLCADGSSACPWAHCVSGQCTAGIDTCPAPADPCAGKSCGDTCSTCTGSGPCNAMAMYCDQNLTCQVNQPVCGATSCKSNGDCPSTACGTCPNGSTTSCVPEACIGGQCTAACSGTSPCGTCATGTTCVYQIGGPGGPEGFRCSTQNPCGAAGRCACIVGEGTCMDPPDSTGYCACDNGLE